jgi:uncharacterized membrane protein YhhN
MRYSWLLLIPAALSVAATRTDFLPCKMGVPLSCALLLVAVAGNSQRKQMVIIPVAFAFGASAVGDYFLSNKLDSATYFVWGIAAFFIAHLGYLAYSIKVGQLHWRSLWLLWLGYLIYFILYLYPAIDSPVLSLSVLIYLLISCVVLSAALGMQTGGVNKWGFALGVVLIVVSDTLISLNEFLQCRQFNSLILPTYYLAHLSISLSLMSRLAEIDSRGAAKTGV